MDIETPSGKPTPPPHESPGGSRPPPLPPASPPPRRALMAWIVVSIMVLLFFILLNAGQVKHVEMPFEPDFRQMVEDENRWVERVEIVREASGITYLRGERKGEAADTHYPLQFKVHVMPTDTLEAFLRENQIGFAYVPQNPVFIKMLGDFLPVVLIFGLLYFLFVRQMRAVGQGAMSFGKNRARMLNRDHHKITFDNVAGVEEAKEEVQEIVEYLKAPQRFQRLGGRIPKGVLLMGPPGTGKTLLAKAIAGEADVPFFSISGSDFVEMFVGVGASRVRDMFEQGKKHAPCLIFIDEIDAVGRSRFSGVGGGHDEREQTLNALLVEMDGFETSDGVIILAATNRPDVLDPALLRPGRFDRQITIDLPTQAGRLAILKMHAIKLILAPEVDLRRLARGTPGFSGADLANLLNEAALLAAREDKQGVEEFDLEEARDKVRWGRERRSRVLDDREKRITAFHEAGHAVVMCLVHESEPLHKITIIPRGMAYLGATMFLPEKEHYLENRGKMKGRLATMMAGRVSEERFIGDITFGASNDLREATRLARAMVCEWGMSETLGPRTFGAREELMFLGREVSRSQDYSDETALRIDREVDRLLREAYDESRDWIAKNADKVELLAGMLIEHETIDGRDAEDWIRFGRILSEEERRKAYPKRAREDTVVGDAAVAAPPPSAADGGGEPGPSAPPPDTEAEATGDPSEPSAESGADSAAGSLPKKPAAGTDNPAGEPSG